MYRRWLRVGVWIPLLAVGCAHSRFYSRALDCTQRNNHEAAVEYLVCSLRAKPGYEPALAQLRISSKKVIRDHKRLAEANAKRQRWDKAVSEYLKLFDLAETISMVLPGAEEIDVNDALATATKQAAEVHYAAGVKAKTAGESKKAAIHFRSCLGLVSGYKDAAKLYDEQKRLGSKTVAIMPFTGSMPYQARNLGELVADEVLATVNKQKLEFLRFVSRAFLKQVKTELGNALDGAVDESTAPKLGKLYAVHAFVVGKVTSANMNDTQWHQERFQNTVNIPFTDSQGNKRQRSVSASWTVFSRTTSAELSVSFQIIDVETGEIKLADQISRDAQDQAQYARYQGDMRALPFSVWPLVRQQRREPRPAKNLLTDAAKSVGQAIGDKVSAEFR